MTLATLCSGTPRPPRLSSMRIRKRAIRSSLSSSVTPLSRSVVRHGISGAQGSGQTRNIIPVQPVLNRVTLRVAMRQLASGRVLHQVGEVTGGIAEVTALKRHERETLQGN